MEGRQIRAVLVLVVISCVGFQIRASDPIFIESFDESFDGRWIVSEKDDYKGSFSFMRFVQICQFPSPP
ncbi:hypothetical protein CK203_047957 [Vitis vinifera]|uniref:Calnexin n=1 Tax=Vitis vinifera TaxID=29760 RepID=A0A438CT68_VITVI|nr:hypothetical protein CK203_086092 [Vitis vinifera]RVW71511.1 hypothetical protein CK203_047957 [Vitis vinifera]